MIKGLALNQDRSLQIDLSITDSLSKLQGTRTFNLREILKGAKIYGTCSILSQYCPLFSLTSTNLSY